MILIGSMNIIRLIHGWKKILESSIFGDELNFKENQIPAYFNSLKE